MPLDNGRTQYLCKKGGCFRFYEQFVRKNQCRLNIGTAAVRPQSNTKVRALISVLLLLA